MGRRRPLFVGILLLGVAGIMTTSAGSAHASGTQSKADEDGTVWLCRLGLAHDPCTASLKTR